MEYPRLNDQNPLLRDYLIKFQKNNQIQYLRVCERTDGDAVVLFQRRVQEDYDWVSPVGKD